MIKASILVVDDDDALRVATARILRRDGHQVVEVHDGEEALRACAAQRFDVIFVDLVMPRMSGRAVADAITALHPGARIIFMSGAGPAAAPTGALFVWKPFTPTSLRAALESATL